MKKYCVALFLMLFGGLFLNVKISCAATFTPSNEVIITEVLMGTATSASQEFIEIYNNTDHSIDLSGWHVQYASATKIDWTSPSRNIALTGTLNSKAYYLLSSTGYLTSSSNLTYSSTLSQTGGHLRIINSSSNLEDQIGWGTALMPLGTAVAAPAAGNSVARLTNSQGYNLSEDNSTDFSETQTPTPLLDNVITLDEPDSDTGGGATSSSSGPTTPPIKVSYPDIQLSEIYPNPASPLTDSQDEFIELYNPNNFDVDLNSYYITAGLTSNYKYFIKNTAITAGGYITFYSRDTNLSLSNTTSKVQIYAPDNTLVDETSPYSKAVAGQSWIYSNGEWLWTTIITPNAENIYTPAVVANKVPKTTKAVVPKVKSARKVAKSTKAKPSKKTKANKPLSVAKTPQQTTIHPVVLAGVGSSALLYGLYEYRYDMANSVYKLRRYRETGGDFWPALTRLRRFGITRRLGRWQNNLRAWLSTRFRK